MKTTTETTIQANELRVGNAVKYFDTQCLVKKINFDNVSYYIGGVDKMSDLVKYYNVIDAFHPIPLTPEILEKCGWFKERIGDYDYYITPEDGFASNFPIWWYRDEICIAPMGIDAGHISIQYLHQLQNLYFTLTGKELEINL